MRMRIAGVVTGLALGVVALPAAAQDPPVPAGPVLLIAEREVDRLGTDEPDALRGVIQEADGSARRLVPGGATSLSWSPDGGQVAYIGEGGEVRVVGRDGAGDRPLLDGGLLSASPWSPDASAVVAAVGSGAESRLVVVEVATGAVRTVIPLAEAVDDGVEVSAPVWSPDGQHLAFGLQSADPERQGVWLVEAAGGPLRRLIPGASAGAWSPDASAVAGVAMLEWDGMDRLAIVIAGVDGNTKVITDPLPSTADQVPLWSPAGTQLAYLACDSVCDVRFTVVRDMIGGMRRVEPRSGAFTVVTPQAFTSEDTVLASELALPDRTVLFEYDLISATSRLVAARMSVSESAVPAPGEVRQPQDATVARSLWWSRQRPVGGTTTALLARSDDFGDSLASGGVQGALGAPLLLTPPDRLDPAVIDELARLGVNEVVLLGGFAALSDEVDGALRASGLTTRRLAGPDRIATSIALAESALPEPRTVFLVRGFGDALDPTRAFADSIAAGAAAAALRVPVLLTDIESLSPQVDAYLQHTPSVEEVVIIGGEFAVAPAVADRVAELGPVVTRVAGGTRFATAAAVARFTLEANTGDDTPPPDGGTYVLTSGQERVAWADGFAAALTAEAGHGGGVLLADDDSINIRATHAVLADAPPGSRVVCGSMLFETLCRDAVGAHATSDPEELGVADLRDEEVVVNVELAGTGSTLCIVIAAEGASVEEVHIGSIFLQGTGEESFASCSRGPTNDGTIGRLLDNAAEVIVNTDDGRELRGPLVRAR